MAFRNQPKGIALTVKGNLIANHSAVIKQALLANQGIARLPEYLLSKEITDKKIKVLFREHTNIETPIYAIYQSHIKTPKKIKMFLEFMKNH